MERTALEPHSEKTHPASYFHLQGGTQHTGHQVSWVKTACLSSHVKTAREGQETMPIAGACLVFPRLWELFFPLCSNEQLRKNSPFPGQTW